jgi:hypothetical protein
MKIWPRKMGAGLFLFLILGLITSSFKTYDYGLECTHCLREYHVVEKSCLGITYLKTQTLQFAGYDHEFEEITGKPCEHIYRTSGFGRQTYAPFFLGSVEGDGITSEGVIFRYRREALKQAFVLYQRIPNKELALQTFAVIDECLPASATVKGMYDPIHPAAKNWGYPLLLANNLESVQSETEWKTALEKAKADLAANN